MKKIGQVGRAVLAVVAPLAIGCSQRRDVEDTRAAASAAVVHNGVELNGTRFNGTKFNGVSLNPLRLDGLSLDGTSLTAVHLDGAKLSGTVPGRGIVQGTHLVGVELHGTLGDATAVSLRIDGVSATADADIEHYAISIETAGASSYEPLCTAPDGTVVDALPLAGSWDDSEGTPTGGAHVDDASVFTFACEDYALAKCVDFGYAPWRTASECASSGDCATRSLASYHEACTRLLRADYCGDGTPTTRDGTQVDLWDALGIQTDDEPSWSLEAEWGAAGAVCVDATRWASLPDGEGVADYVRQHCPARWQAAGCGGANSTFFPAKGFTTPLANRSLLRSRVSGGSN